jgi:hypothetical protein
MASVKNIEIQIDAQLREYVAELESKLAELRELVSRQAYDAALWVQAGTAFEAYLQQELRRLHAAVEEDEK